MTFPALRPTSREFIPPPYPISTVNTISQTAVRLLLASKPGQATLSLTYENLSDQNANSFVQNYEDSKGQMTSLVLPAEAVSGLGEDFDSYVKSIGSDLTWRWDGPPRLDSVKKGVTTVVVTLKAFVNPGNLVRLADAPANPYEPPVITDTTKYPSFTGSVITPPSPPTPGVGKKWISYSQITIPGSLATAPIYDNDGNIYMVRTVSGKLSVSKYTPNGSPVWRQIVEFIEPWDPGVVFPLTFATTQSDSRLFSVCIHNNTLVIYSVVEIGQFAIGSFVLVGFLLDGTFSYLKRYPVPGSVPRPIYNNVNGQIYVHSWVGFSPLQGFNISSFDPDTGSILNVVVVNATSAERTSGGYLPRDLCVKSNGNLVMIYAGSTINPIIVEIDNSLSFVVRSSVYAGIDFYGLTYRPDSGGFISCNPNSFLVTLDDSLQIVEQRTFTAYGSDFANGGADTRSFYIGSGYYYITSGALLMVAGPSNSRTVAKYNWSTDTIDYITFITNGFYTISPGRKRIWTTASSDYHFMRMAELDLPTTANTITTPNPPNVSLFGVTQYAPTRTSRTVPVQAFRYNIPMELSGVPAYDEVTVYYRHYSEFLDMDIITDLA